MKATTKDEAINIMLSMIGESPVTSPTTSSSADAQTAIRILDEASKEMQSAGWHFNREYEVTLSPDAVTKEILLAENVLQVDVEPQDSWFSGTKRIDAIMRGKTGGLLFLYDKANHTFEFSSDVKATVVYGLEWDTLPEIVRNYLIKRAGRIFNARVVGDANQNQFLLMEEHTAQLAVRNWEAEASDNTVFDHWATYRIINRHGIPNSI